MEKKEYITPKVRSVDVRSRYGLLDETMSETMSVGGIVSDPGDIGFSKGTDFDDDDIGDGKGVWED